MLRVGSIKSTTVLKLEKVGLGGDRSRFEAHCPYDKGGGG